MCTVIKLSGSKFLVQNYYNFIIILSYMNQKNKTAIQLREFFCYWT